MVLLIQRIAKSRIAGDAITFATVTNIVLRIVEQNTHGAVMKELKYLSQSMMGLSALIEYILVN